MNTSSHLLQIIEDTGFGAWDWDVKSNTLVWTDSLYGLYGVKKEDFSGAYEAWEQTVHPEDKEKAIKELQDALNGVSEFNTTFRIIHSDKSVRYIKAKAKAYFKDGEATAYRISGLNWDYTKEMQESITLNNIQREIEVKKIHSQKLAALGEMAAGIAHEINNPLTIILGKVMLLQQRLETEGASEQSFKELNKISSATLRAAKIVKSMRNLSRSDSEKAPHSLNELVEEVLELSKEKLALDKIDLRLSLESSEKILMQPGEISQVLINLINNSMYAIRNLESKWIEISTVSFPNATCIRITDSGSIPVEIQSKLMQPFFTTKPIGEGTGLGLSLSKTLVENNGGTLHLDKYSKNTAFIISFPNSSKLGAVG
jgi:C4-dicarboxylate-specific signal transduction histidine kinase